MTSFKSYLSVNAGYTNYEQNDIKREDIPIALGLYCYTFTSGLYWYLGAELGALYRKEKTFNDENIPNENSDNVKMLATIAFGIAIPISKSLNLYINLKDHYVIKDFINTRLSTGLSYSF